MFLVKTASKGTSLRSVHDLMLFQSSFKIFFYTMKNVGIHTINFFLSNYFVVSSNNSSCFENFVKDIFQDRAWECQKLAFTHPIVVLKSGLGNNWMQKLDCVNRPLNYLKIGVGQFSAMSYL